MVTDKRIVDISSDDVTVLGHQGEHLTRVVRFPQGKEWRDALGPGEAFLLVRRPGEETNYPAPLDAEDDGTVLWAVRREDVERSGEGQVQLTYRLGDRVARSQTFRTRVEESLDRPGPAPAPQQGWVDQVMASETAARASADRAEQAAAGVENISQQVQQVENAKNAALLARDEAQKAAEGVKDVGQQVQQVQKGVAAAQAAADRAQAATVHGPKIEAGKWQVWDSTGGQYADTGVRAVGKTPALTIGTVETLPAEEKAAATITGTDEAPVLNLSLPRGKAGEAPWVTLFDQRVEFPSPAVNMLKLDAPQAVPYKGKHFEEMFVYINTTDTTMERLELYLLGMHMDTYLMKVGQPHKEERSVVFRSFPPAFASGTVPGTVKSAPAIIGSNYGARPTPARQYGGITAGLHYQKRDYAAAPQLTCTCYGADKLNGTIRLVIMGRGEF